AAQAGQRFHAVIDRAARRAARVRIARVGRAIGHHALRVGRDVAVARRAGDALVELASGAIHALSVGRARVVASDRSADIGAAGYLRGAIAGAVARAGEDPDAVRAAWCALCRRADEACAGIHVDTVADPLRAHVVWIVVTTCHPLSGRYAMRRT